VIATPSNKTPSNKTPTNKTPKNKVQERKLKNKDPGTKRTRNSQKKKRIQERGSKRLENAQNRGPARPELALASICRSKQRLDYHQIFYCGCLAVNANGTLDQTTHEIIIHEVTPECLSNGILPICIDLLRNISHLPKTSLGRRPERS
jgi:hypothetical protein